MIADLLAPAVRYGGIVGSNAVKGGLEGLGSIGTAQDYLQRGVDIPADWLAALMGLRRAEPTSRSPLSSNALVGYGRAAGVVDRPDLAPQTMPERYAASIAESMGAAVPYTMLTGNVGLGQLIARGGLPGAVSGAMGEYGSQLLPDYAALARWAGNKAGSGAFGLASRPVNATATTAALSTTNPRADRDAVAALRDLLDRLLKRG